MAVVYWNSGAATTTSTTDVNYYFATSTNTGTTDWGWIPYPRVVQKSVWVNAPAHWKKKVLDAYVRLVNDETHTGWKVTALVNGSVEVCDPYADIRNMQDFVPLLKARANSNDCKKIDSLFKKHGLTEKPKKKRATRKKSGK